MLTDKEKTVKVFREWFCKVLTEMKQSLAKATDENIANLGIKYIKPLLEFSSYHKDKLKYQNKTIDYSDKIKISLEILPNTPGIIDREIEVLVPRYQKAVKFRFYDIYWPNFSHILRMTHLDNIPAW